MGCPTIAGPVKAVNWATGARFSTTTVTESASTAPYSSVTCRPTWRVPEVPNSRWMVGVLPASTS